jgi:hypothetical protein
MSGRCAQLERKSFNIWSLLGGALAGKFAFYFEEFLWAHAEATAPCGAADLSFTCSKRSAYDSLKR